MDEQLPETNTEVKTTEEEISKEEAPTEEAPTEEVSKIPEIKYPDNPITITWIDNLFVIAGVKGALKKQILLHNYQEVDDLINNLKKAKEDFSQKEMIISKK